MREVIQTGLTERYVKDFTIFQASKEAIQNIAYGAIKSKCPPAISFDGPTCIIEDSYHGMEKRHLYLGESDQAADKDGIGNFGEGWKLWMLVLARNGIPHRCDTVGFSFHGEMVDTPHGVRSLHIVVEENARVSGTAARMDVSYDVFERATKSFASLQDIKTANRVGESLDINPSAGVISGRRAELWIAGIRVETESNPNPMNLWGAYLLTDRSLTNRDRTTVDSYTALCQIRRCIYTCSDERFIEDYVRAVLSGDDYEDIKSPPIEPYSFSGKKDVQDSQRARWRDIVALIHDSDSSSLFIPSGFPNINTEAEYKGYKALNFPIECSWNDFLSTIGFKKARDVCGSKVEILPVGLSGNDVSVLKRAKTDAKKALGLKFIGELPSIIVVNKISDENGLTNSSGLYIFESNTILIRHDIMCNQKETSITLIHECIHWNTGAADFDVAFRVGFEKAIARLLGY